MRQTERYINDEYIESNKTKHIPNKIFSVNDIVYWVENNHRNKPYVNFGVVTYSYDGRSYNLTMIEPNVKKVVQRFDEKKNTFIDICDINDFVTDDCYYKLPKKWNYNMELFKIKEEYFNKKEVENINVKNPTEIKKALKKGIIRTKNAFNIKIEEEIDKGMFRLVRKSEQDYLFAKSKDACYIFKTYEECQKVCNEIEEENIRIANLSDYDFNLEELNNKLDFLFKDDELTKEKYRKYFLSKDNFEDIEFKYFGHDLQWRYWKNKKWLNVDLG